jgi:hypothetical protein
MPFPNGGLSAIMSAPYHRVVTLLQILETSAEAWWRLASMTGQLLVRLETSIPPPDVVVATLGELQLECDKLSLTSASSQLSRIREDGFVAGVPFHILGPKLQRMVYELNLRISDELDNRFFLSIPFDLVEYYRQPSPVFGDEVENKLPEVSEDISEAGKCLALNRRTAAVFHLSRAMERAVLSLGAKMGVTVIDKDNVELEWGKILANLSVPIERMQKGERKDKWSAAFVLLLHTKTAWRNPTMHPKQTYTEEQARDIFGAAKAFMRSLVELV